MVTHSGPNSQFSGESLAIIKTAQRALTELDRQSDKAWTYWKQVGAGFVEIRTLAMREAGTNSPYGRAYTGAYARLLTHFKLGEKLKDPGDRQKLVAVMDNLPAIEAWLGKLTKEQRRWTHPTSIYRNWQKSLVPPKNYAGASAKEQKEAVQDALTDKVIALGKEKAQLQRETYRPVKFDSKEEAEEFADTLGNYSAIMLRDILIKRYPLQLPKVIPSDDAYADLPPVRLPSQEAE